MTVLAHRGGTGPWRENTLEAFVGALGAGADGVELDVRRSADGELVVHHDADVPGSGLIHQRRRDQLPEWVPTLERALAACAGAIVNVEIKNVPTDAGYDPTNRVSVDVADVVGRLSPPRSPGRPTSWCRRSGPTRWPRSGADRDADRDGDLDNRAPLGLFVHPSLDARVRARHCGVGLGCAALHPHHSQVRRRARPPGPRSGCAVVTWTVNRPEDLDAVVAPGWTP